jgi:hypothetical protein
MLRACGFAITASLAGVAGTGASAARADREKAEEVVELRYAAPPECPTRDAAVGLIRERTPAVRFAAGARRVFAISVAAGEHGYTGALVVDATADKQLTAQRCDDLVTALALVISLAIDPAAAARDEPVAVTMPAPPVPPPPPRQRAWTLDGSLAGELGAGVTPDPLLAGGLAARVTRRALAAELTIVAGRDTTRAAEASASFTRIIARPAACRLTIRLRLELGGCGHAELGIVHATGDDIVNGRGLTRLWAAAGVYGSLRWPASISGGFAQLQLGLAVPFTRDRYRFMPGTVIHETPPVTGWLGLRVGLRFP